MILWGKPAPFHYWYCFLEKWLYLTIGILSWFCLSFPRIIVPIVYYPQCFECLLVIHALNIFPLDNALPVRRSLLSSLCSLPFIFLAFCRNSRIRLGTCHSPSRRLLYRTCICRLLPADISCGLIRRRFCWSKNSDRIGFYKTSYLFSHSFLIFWIALLFHS